MEEYNAVRCENVGAAMGPMFTGCSPEYVNSDKHNDPAHKTEYPLPGSHSNVAKVDNPMGVLSNVLCQQFLLKHGTKVLAADTMTAAQMLEQCAKIFWRHHKTRTSGIIDRKTEIRKGGVSVWRAANVQNSERAHKFFVNHHHASLFGSFLPCFAAYMAGGAGIGVPISGEEIQNLTQRFPDTLRALRAVGYL